VTARPASSPAAAEVAASAAAWAIAGLLAAYACSIMVRGPGHYSRWLDAALPLAVELPSAALALWWGLIRGRDWTVSGPLAVGLTLWSLGDLTWQLQSQGTGVPVPSISDGLFLAFYPLVYRAELGEVRRRASRSFHTSWLDGLVAGLAAAALCAGFGLDAILSATGASTAEVAVNLAYPVGDLVLLVLSVGTAAVIPRESRQTWLLLGGGVLFGISDSLYLIRSAADTYVEGTWIDVGWPAAVLLLALACRPDGEGQRWIGRRLTRLRAGLTRGSTDVRPPGRLPVVGGLGLFTGVGILIEGDLHRLNLLTTGLAALCLLTAMVRIGITLRELGTLEAERARRADAETAQRHLATQAAEISCLAARLQGLLDAAPVGIAETDPGGRVLRWNRAAERIYGWTEPEMLGTPGVEPITEPGAPGHAGQVERYRRRDGAVIEVEVVQEDLLDDDGRLSGRILVFTDVTRRRELEAILRNQQKLESLAMLASGIAHEINTPIQFITHNLTFLQETCTALLRICQTVTPALDDPAPGDPLGHGAVREQVRRQIEDLDLDFLVEEAPVAAHEALEGVTRVADIVRGMRLLGQHRQAPHVHADLNEIVHRAMGASDGLLDGVEVELNLANLPLVPCNPEEIEQALVNVLVNAAQAIEDCGGRVAVSTRRETDHVLIQVCDTGPGMPSAVASRIFDPFYTTKPVGKGTGQGLTLAWAVIVDRHAGSIHVESQPGAGSTFTLRLPIRGSQHHGGPEAQASVASGRAVPATEATALTIPS
jgi:PAS domain S-box-containing protein